MEHSDKTLIVLPYEIEHLVDDIVRSNGIEWEESVFSVVKNENFSRANINKFVLGTKVVSILGKCKSYGKFYLKSNSSAKVFVPIGRYSFIDHFGGKYARVNIENKETGKRRWGVIDFYGMEILPVKFDYIKPFNGKIKENIEILICGEYKWYNLKYRKFWYAFPYSLDEPDPEYYSSDRDNFYAMTDGANGEYEDVYGIDYYDE